MALSEKVRTRDVYITTTQLLNPTFARLNFGVLTVKQYVIQVKVSGLM